MFCTEETFNLFVTFLESVTPLNTKCPFNTPPLMTDVYICNSSRCVVLFVECPSCQRVNEGGLIPGWVHHRATQKDQQPSTFHTHIHTYKGFKSFPISLISMCLDRQMNP